MSTAGPNGLKRFGPAYAEYRMLLEVENLSYTYPGATQPTLKAISLTLAPGEFVLLIGPSGSGKTTLLQALAGVVPHSMGGTIRGQLCYHGEDFLRNPDLIKGRVGLVLQDPEAQLISLYVEDEVAFGPENLLLDVSEIRRRVEWALSHARLTAQRHDFVYALSGGQKQRIAIAAGVAMQPELLLMDGPTSNLDPIGAAEVIRLIEDLRTNGHTEAFIIAENKVDELLPWASRVIVIDDGAIVLDGTPEYVFLEHLAQLEALGVFIPQAAMLAKRLARLDNAGAVKLHDSPAAMAATLGPAVAGYRREPQVVRQARDVPVVEIEELRFGYTDAPLIYDLSLKVTRSEFLGVLGRNGSGKTTLMKLMSGLLAPDAGWVRILGRDTRKVAPLGKVGYVFQYPEHQFVTQTVRQELELSLKTLPLKPAEKEQRIGEMLTLFELTVRQDESPYLLSMGEKRRLSVATMVIMEPAILILDEPTTGLDHAHTTRLMQILRSLVQEKGITLLQVSHDMEQVAEFCDRVVVIDDGSIIFDGMPSALFMNEAVLQRAQLQAPFVAQVARALWPDLGASMPITVDQFLKEINDAFAGVPSRQ